MRKKRPGGKITAACSNGDQVNRLAGLAMAQKPSVDFSGYWQRHVKSEASGMNIKSEEEWAATSGGLPEAQTEGL